MRRTTWAMLVAILLVVAVSYGPTARADELGEPPAGAASPAGSAAAPVLVPAPAAGEPVAAPALPPPPSPIIDAVPCAPRVSRPPLPDARSYAVTAAWCRPAPCPATCPPPCPPGPICGQPRDDRGWAVDRCGKRYGRWEILLEGALTWIHGPAGLLGEPVPAGTPAFDWGRNEYDPEFGGRLSISYRLCPGNRIELRGGYLGNWTAASRQRGAFGFSPPEGGVSPVSPANLYSEAELYGGELNYWRELGCVDRTRFEAGIGLRYVRFDELATLRGLPLPTGAGGAFVSSDVSNQLFAAQLGAAYYWDVTSCLELSLIGKALLGGHYRETFVYDASVLSGGAHRSSSDATDFGWGFELEGHALYRITPRIGVTAGAAVLYLGEAGRAQDGFDFTQAGTGAVQSKQESSGLIAVTFLVGLHLNF